MTKEQLSKEVEYKMALKLLKILLNRGMITDEEYLRIDELNRQTFSPELREVYV
ncbi:SHOCT domain-containing protein [Tissierella praeacuta]|uniref:SHOCT domain-containing protein n=1 Tax=Tissierella praeacuta TaxID=43131 RepID=UPI003342CE90